jgi:nucleoside-diphosphate-sugar epimerase
MNHYLVTGGAGFIGSHIAEELVRRGERVRVLDNFITGKQENLVPFRNFIELIDGDIRELETCRRALRGVGFVPTRPPCHRCPGRLKSRSWPTISMSTAP